MCLAMNPDTLQARPALRQPSNRNFEGDKARLVAPTSSARPLAAAAAVTGHFVEVRQLSGRPRA